MRVGVPAVGVCARVARAWQLARVCGEGYSSGDSRGLRSQWTPHTTHTQAPSRPHPAAAHHTTPLCVHPTTHARRSAARVVFTLRFWPHAPQVSGKSKYGMPIFLTLTLTLTR